jgi:viologen exporter family transport system permease protein
MSARRYVRLLGVQVRASMQTVMQYRTDFLVQGAMSLYWLAWNLLPLFILYEDRTTVEEWDFPSALVVIAWFVILRGILEGAINPSLVDVVERIRTGSFDYVLLKPADNQFLVSTARFDPWRVVDIVGGIVILIYAFTQLGRAPAPADVAAGVLLLAAGVIVMYSLWLGVVAASFWVIRLDNLTFLLDAIFDTARWPVQVFKGAWRILFTFVLPLALMTTYPAMAILGRIDVTTALACVAGALAIAALSRFLWVGAVRNYTSASS